MQPVTSDEFGDAFRKTAEVVFKTRVKKWFTRLYLRGVVANDFTNLDAARGYILFMLDDLPHPKYCSVYPLPTNFLVEMANAGVLLEEEPDDCGYNYDIYTVPSEYRVLLQIPSAEVGSIATTWTYRGVCHNLYDFPAYIGRVKEWWKMGEMTRDRDEPTVQTKDSVRWVDTNRNLKPRPWRYLPVVITSVGGLIFLKDDHNIVSVDGVKQTEEADVGCTMETVFGGFEWRNLAGNLSRGRGLPCQILFDGTLIWRLGSDIGRSFDQPAVITYRFEEGRINTQSKWYIDGKVSRGYDKPACVIENGDPSWEGACQKWLHNGVLHRVGGPAVITATACLYYDNGKNVPEPVLMKVQIDPPLIVNDDRMEEECCLICAELSYRLYTTVPCGHIFSICDNDIAGMPNKCPTCRGDVGMYLKSFKQ